MAHPYAAHRQTAKEHSRVGHITRGYKSGGAVHKDAAEDRKLIRSMVKKSDLKADGDKAAHRMDRPKRAKGGRIKRADGGVANPPAATPLQIKNGIAMNQYGERGDKLMTNRGKGNGPRTSDYVGSYERAKGGRVKGNAKTVINVITGGHPTGGAVPMPPPMPPAGVAGAAMPPPPVAAKPPMMPPPGASGPPPGMPLRAKGGRVQTPTGSGVAKNTRDAEKNHGSPVFNASMRNGTQISGTGNNKDEGKNVGRGRVVTFWAGGKVKKRADGGDVSKGFYSTKPDTTNDKIYSTPKSSTGDNMSATSTNTDSTAAMARSMLNRAKGGRIESPQGVAPATRLHGGSGGGEARLAKEHRAERK